MKRRNLWTGMRGPDVERINRKLLLGASPVYSRQTADAVLAWKYRQGFGLEALHGGMGTRAQSIMFGEVRRSAVEVARAKVRARFQLKTRPAKRAAPSPTSLRIVPRAEWGARPPRYPMAHCSWDLPYLWVHHSAMPAPRATLAAEMAQVRGIQAYHQGAARGWNDIGYSFVVGQSGNAYEGRGMGVVGAHCPGHNNEPSVCLLVNDEAPSAAALATVRQLQARLGKRSLRPHRAGFATSCPGDRLVKALGL